MIASTLCSTLLGSAFHARQTLTWPRIWPVSDQSDNQTWMSPSVNPSVSVLAIDNSNPNSFSDQLFSMSECANPGGDASLLWSSLHHPDLLLDPLCCYCESSNLCQIFKILVPMSILSCMYFCFIRFVKSCFEITVSHVSQSKHIILYDIQ